MHRHHRHGGDGVSLSRPASTAASFAGGLPTAAAAAASSITRQHFLQTRNPEDVVASRYLQRLGNTFVRKSSPDPADNPHSSGRRFSSFRSKRAGSANAGGATPAALASLAVATPPAAAPSAVQNTHGENGAAATRRWRTQVASPADNVAAPVAPLDACAADGAVVTVGEGRGVGGRAGAQSRVPGSPSRQAGPGALQSTAAAPALGSLPNGRHSGDDSALDEVSGSSAPNRAKAPAAHHAPQGTYSVAAQRADTAVSQAAAFMAAGALTGRKVRTEEERNALLLAQEHAKVMLLVGRHSNLEADIDDMLELADHYERESREAEDLAGTVSVQAASHGVLSASSAAHQLSSTVVSGDGGGRKRGESISTAADIDAELNVEARVVRRRMRQLLSGILGNGVLGSAGGATTIDAANLSQLVQQLQAQLDTVEEALAEKMEEREGDELMQIEAGLTAQVQAATAEQSARGRANSTTSSIAAMLQPAAVLTLLQQRKQAFHKLQVDTLDAYSSNERMEWLLDSVDAELVTDVPAELRAAEALAEKKARESPPPAPPSPRPLPAASSAAPAGAAVEASPLPVPRNHTATPEALATVLSLPAAGGLRGDDRDGSLLRSVWAATVVSQPSLVPFSLRSSTSPDGAATSSSSGYDGAMQLPTATQHCPPDGLNLLGFMVDVLAQYNLSLDTATDIRKRRPLTAPSLVSSPASRLPPMRGGFNNTPPSPATERREGTADGDAATHEVDEGEVVPAFAQADAAVPTAAGQRKRSVARVSTPPARDEEPVAAFQPGRSSAGRRRQSAASMASDRNRRASKSINLPSSASSAGPAAAAEGKAEGQTFLGAQLRNLRAGLLQDLRELCTLYDYMHLIDERRRELLAGVGEKGADDYGAELEQRLEEHRLQQEALQRARNEELRRKAETGDLDTFGQASQHRQPRRSHEAAPQPHQQQQQQRKSAVDPPKQGETQQGRTTSTAETTAAPPPATTQVESNAATAGDEEAVATELEPVPDVEVELTREVVGDGKLIFTLVGIAAGARTASAAAAEERKAKASKKKGAGSASGKIGDSYLRYELRVERALLSEASPLPETGNAEEAPALVAVVKVNPRRLVNLQLAPADAASLITRKKSKIVTVVVKDGAEPSPQLLLTLAPVKRYKSSSFAKAMEFAAEAEQQADADNSCADSVASMPFALPSPKDGRGQSLSSSLDSADLLPLPTQDDGLESSDDSEPLSLRQPPRAVSVKKSEEVVEVAGAAAATAPSKPKSPKANKKKKRVSTVAVANKQSTTTVEKQTRKKSTVTTAAVAAPEKPAVKVERRQPSNSGDVQASVSAGKLPTPAAPVERKTDTPHGSTLLPPLGSRVSLTSAASVVHLPSPPHPAAARTVEAEEPLPAEAKEMSLIAQAGEDAAGMPPSTPLPAAPPLQEEPRPIEEWGTTQHSHPAMEAVERNAVVLTVLAAYEEELPWVRASDGAVKPGQPAASIDTDAAADSAQQATPVEALLATIPDEAVSDLVQSMTAAGVARQPSVTSHAARRDSGAVAAAGSRQQSLVDAVATELLRQVMLEEPDDEGEEEAAAMLAVSAGSHGGKRGSASLAVGELDEGLRGSFEEVQAEAEGPTAAEVACAPFTEEAEESSRRASGTASAGDGAALPPPQPAAKEPLTTAPPRAASLASKSVIDPQIPTGRKPAPSLTITSAQSPPMSADEAQQYAGGVVRFDGQDVEATAPMDVSAPIPERQLSAAAAVARRRSSSVVVAAGLEQQPSHKGTAPSLRLSATAEADPAAVANAPAPMPQPVLVEKHSNSTKVHLFLPLEALAGGLGPQVGATPDTQTRGSSAASGAAAAQRQRQPSAQPSTPARNHTADAPPAEDFSVLPTTGPAAEAAADVRTVAQVQTFLQAVMRHTSGAASSTASGAPTRGSEASTSAGSMGPVRSEMDQLQEEARQLFMLDPVRYDAVVSELMQQAAEELQRDMSAAQPGRSGATSAASRTSLRSGQAGLPPLLVASHSAGPSTGRASDALMLTGNGAESSSVAEGWASLHLVGSPRAVGGRGRVSIVQFTNNDVPRHDSAASSSSFPRQALQAALPEMHHRSTHTLWQQSGASSSATTRRVSRADAVAEVERILYEQMKAKLLLRAIIDKMQALWQAKQRNTEEKKRGRVAQRMRRVVHRALAASWSIERQRVMNLKKLIYLLDRKVGRVHGWLPHYSDTNVLMTATSTVSKVNASLASSARVFLPLSTWYRGKDAAGRVASEEQDGDGCSCGGEECPRYLRYLPQRRIYHYVRLAKSRRMMPLRLVRADIQESHSRHILLGYEKTPLETVEAAQAATAAPIHTGWPRRDLPQHARRGMLPQRGFVKEYYEDMRTRGERERYRRRLQGAAAFQSASKMFSPRTQHDADLPFALH